MSNQIFKEMVPNELFTDFIKSVGFKYNNYYVINPDSYKKSKFIGNLDSFIESIKPYYYESKQYYLNRKMSYKNMVTIIRQILKKNNIKYVNKIHYQNSDYTIQYYIYID